MLQVNPAKRPSTDEFLKHEIMIKITGRMKMSNKQIENEEKIQPLTLLGTIKLPRNMNEINQRLPKKKMYNQDR